MEARKASEPKTIAEALDEAFPQYLAMGMTPRQYWEEDCTLVIAYRKAYQIRQEHENQMAWLQGVYILKALQSAPIYVNGFVPRGAVIEPYWDKPYDFGFGRSRKMTEEETNRKKMQDVENYMQTLAARFNKSFQNRKAKQEQENKPEAKPEQETKPEQE